MIHVVSVDRVQWPLFIPVYAVYFSFKAMQEPPRHTKHARDAMTRSIAMGLPLLVVLVLAAAVRVRSRKRTGSSAAAAAAATPPRVPFELDYKGVDAAPGILRVIALLLPDFALDSHVITQIQGGITNLLWKVSGPSGSVLVRVYGENTELMFDRQQECALFGELAARGFGPKLLGLFANGRIEGYFEASRNLEHYEMGQTAPVDFPSLIAHELARMHAITDMPVPKTPRIWHVLDQWLALASAVCFPEDAAKQALLRSFDLAGFARELEWLKTRLPSPVNAHGAAWGDCGRGTALAIEPVFCHNDALSGNVLYLSRERRCQLIDFEYGGYNYRAFDVANHFCEYAGFDFDLARFYPTSPMRRHFLAAYCASSNLAPLSAADLAALEQLTNRFALCAHALWFLWAVLQARHSVIPVDFIDYARKRREGFFAHKKEFC